jgi:hypothetical protein
MCRKKKNAENIANTPSFLLPLTLSHGLNNYIDVKAENFCGFARHLCV